MANEVRQYDLTQLVGSYTVPIGTFDVLDGVIEGDFLSISQDSPDWVLEADAFGNVTYVFQPKRTGTIQITISASSPTNGYLSAIRTADRATRNMVGVLVLKDLNGTTRIEADGVRIAGPPTKTFGTQRGSVQWTFLVATLRVFAVGGMDTV
jgi:hypothetical protein